MAMGFITSRKKCCEVHTQIKNQTVDSRQSSEAGVFIQVCKEVKEKETPTQGDAGVYLNIF